MYLTLLLLVTYTAMTEVSEQILLDNATVLIEPIHQLLILFGSQQKQDH